MLLITTTVYADNNYYTTNSVLSKGKWYKIHVEKTGVYKIQFSELQKMGFPDLNQVSIHGYGGNPLDEDFSTLYIDDLPEIPVYKRDDYILFYAKGPVKWEYSEQKYTDDSKHQVFRHTNNPYSNEGYYFITSNGNSKKMEIIKSENNDAVRTIKSFDDYVLHEKEMYSLNESGRELFGESLYNPEISIPFDLEGITNEDAFIECKLVGKTSSNKDFKVTISGNTVLTGYVPATKSSEKHYSYIKAKEALFSNIWTGDKSDHIIVKVNYSEKYNNTVYLDYIRLNFKRELKAYNKAYTFRNASTLNQKSRFILSDANDQTIIWDVTDAQNPKLMEAELSKTQLSFTIPPENRLREFAFIQLDKTIPTITKEDATEVPNQNLHALPSCDMVIISPSAFFEEAERLKEAHKDHDGLDVIVVTPEEIYNEFSSGTPDATSYRRFMKMFFDRSKSEGTKPPRYLLLFGDGAFDNRFLTNVWQQMSESIKKNMLLTYQTEESLDMYSYPVDDYFGFLEDNETIYEYDKKALPQSTATLDIAVGRFPIRTVKEAKQVVDKTISYMNNSSPGMWKNNICFVADDGNSTDGYLTSHQLNANALATYLETNHPEYINNKLFFDAYNKNLGSGTYPEVKSEIYKKLKEGIFLINYVGHGNTESWSDEKVLNHNDILQYKYTQLPLWITATCDFCRFDSYKTSAGEDVLLNSTGGGIALFTTSRVAFVDINDKINRTMIESLFKINNGEHPRLGDVIKESKLEIKKDGRKLGFCLIGDPALKLSYPKYKIQLTTINGKAVNNEVLQFKAFENVELEGNIVNTDGAQCSDYNGDIILKVFDSMQSRTTLGNNPNKNKISYNDYTNIIYQGTTSIKNGYFKVRFIVPVDISYSTMQTGKMSLYATNNIPGEDASGYFNKYIVGGTAEEIIKDTIGPEIRAIYLNDSIFKNGDKVNTTPYLYVKVWDKSGINITGSSIGHDITLQIDHNPSKNYILNNYYRSVPTNDKEGYIGFLIPELEAGEHFAEFKIWDIMNNPSMDTLRFEVIKGLKPSLSSLDAYPNPARESVSFHLSHDRPECDMKIGIMIYDLSGRLHWSHEETGSSEIFKDYTIIWNLTNNMGSRLKPGVYLYRATISTDNSKEATETKKIIILYAD